MGPKKKELSCVNQVNRCPKHNRGKAQQPGDLEQSLLSEGAHRSTSNISSISLEQHLEATT